jgi:ABC-2 type transport system permease protein
MLEHIKLRLKLLKDDIVLVIVMLAMAIILTMIFGQAFGDDYEAVIQIVDLDNSQTSSEFTQTLIGDVKGFDFREAELEDMKEYVKESQILAGVVLEEGFENDYSKIKIVSGKSAVEIIQLKNSLANTISLMSNKINLENALVETIGTQDDISTEVAQSFDEKYENKTYSTSINTVGESVWSGYNNLMHYVLGFMLFFSTFSMTFVMADILKEKKLHIFQRNLVTPINRASQLAAKMFVTFLLGFAQVAIVLLAGKYLFGIEWGDNLGILLAISACYVLTFTCLGLFLSSVVKSYDQMGAMTPIILVSTAMLGGCMWPMELITNKVLLALSNITPQKWALSAMENIAMKGDPASVAVIPMLVLLGMAVVYFLLGMRVMKKDLV